MLKENFVKICDYVIEGGLLAIIFSVPVIFDYGLVSYNFFDLYKIIAFRVILTLVLLAFTAKIFLTGRLAYRGGAKIFSLAGLMLASFFISSVFSLDPARSFWGSFLRQQGFYNLFNYWLFFVLLIFNLDSFVKMKRAIAAAVASAALTAAYGLAQIFSLDPFSWSESVTNGRIFSAFGQPNFFGHFLAVVLPLSFYALIFLAKRALPRFFIGLGLAAELACLVFTYSRAAWLGFFGSALFLIIFWLFYKRLKKTALVFIGLLFIGAVFIAGLNLISPAESGDYNSSVSLVNRLKSMTDFKGGSNKIRLYYLEAAAEEIRRADPARLLVGYGPEVLGDVLMKYYQIDWGVYESINSFPDRAHNWLLDQILAFGLLGLAAGLAFYLYLIYRAAVFLSARPSFGPDDWLLVFSFSSLAAYFINNLFSFSLFANFVYLHFILALAWLAINRHEETEVLKIRLTAFSKSFIWAALFLTSAVFVYANNLNQAKAEIYYIKALNSIESADCRNVINNMEKVMSLSPNSGYYRENYLFLALNCFSGVKDKSAWRPLSEKMLKQINLLGDKFYGNRLNRARAYAVLGFYSDESYYAEAERIFKGLIADFPYFTAPYEDYGRQKMTQADYAGAAEIFNQALKILPPLDHPHLNDQHRRQISAIAVRLQESAGSAYFKMKDYGRALEYYKKGLSLDPYRATLYKSIADVYYVQGRLEEAAAWNKRGFRLNPGDYSWPLALSFLYRDKKDLTAARDYLDQAIRLAPEDEKLKKYEKELD